MFAIANSMLAPKAIGLLNSLIGISWVLDITLIWYFVCNFLKKLINLYHLVGDSS